MCGYRTSRCRIWHEFHVRKSISFTFREYWAIWLWYTVSQIYYVMLSRLVLKFATINECHLSNILAMSDYVSDVLDGLCNDPLSLSSGSCLRTQNLCRLFRTRLKIWHTGFKYLWLISPGIAIILFCVAVMKVNRQVTFVISASISMVLGKL